MRCILLLIVCLITASLAGKSTPSSPTPVGSGTPSLISVNNGTTLYYINGSGLDVVPTLVLGGPIIDAGGGGTDVDIAFQQMIDMVRGCSGSCATKIDVVILRASGADGYGVYAGLNGVDSVESIVITNPSDANLTSLELLVLKAEVVFFAGGDQCNYVKWKNSKVMNAVRAVYNRGGGIGGTSAGMAILGEWVYDACSSSTGVTGAAALSNPFNSEISFSYNVLNISSLATMITDQHYVTRNRVGRVAAFLARMFADGKTSTVAWAVAANEETSVLIDKNGLATVIGNTGACCLGVEPMPDPSVLPVAYFILLDHPATQILVKKPLIASGYKVWKIAAGGSFNLANRPSINPSYTFDVNGKVITVNGNSGLVY